MSHSFSSTLRIAVVGAGGIGSTFAFQLAREGHHEVTAIARPDSLRWQQLERDRAIVNIKRERAGVLVTNTLDETIPYDLVLVTLQAHQVGPMLPALGRSAAQWVQFMCNTFDPEQLRNAIGADRCSFGMPFLQATITRDGLLDAKIGTGGQESKMDHEGLAEVFRTAGLPAVFEPRMLLWLRCHAPLCAAFESVSVAAMRRGAGASWGEATVIAHGLQESLTLIQRLGYPLYPTGKSRLHASPTWVVATMLWTLSRIPSFRKLLATGVNECNALVDAFVAAEPSADPPVSRTRIQALRP